MKNSPKNYYSGKNRKQQKNNFDSNDFSKNSNSSKKNNRFSINSTKNKGLRNLNESDQKISKFSSFKISKPIYKCNIEVSNKVTNSYQAPTKKIQILVTTQKIQIV